jgi:branched-chain amino acid transport system permease protein
VLSQQISQVVINGVVNGCFYGLIGVGFVVIFRATGVISFAQGAFMAVGALLFGTLNADNLNLYLAVVVVAIVLFVIAALLYRIIFTRIVGGDPFVTAIATVGLGTLVEAVAVVIWGASVVTTISPFSYKVYGWGFYKLSGLDIFTIAATIVLIGVIILALQRTKIGLRMRAVANNTTLAAYSGVNVVRISMLAWGVAGVTAGVAGVAFILANQTNPGSVYTVGLAAFPAILLGGFDSIPGSLVGGILIGLIQAAVGTWVGGVWQEVVAYLVLLGVLLVRPQGLFGSAEVARL